MSNKYVYIYKHTYLSYIYRFFWILKLFLLMPFHTRRLASMMGHSWTQSMDAESLMFTCCSHLTRLWQEAMTSGISLCSSQAIPKVVMAYSWMNMFPGPAPYSMFCVYIYSFCFIYIYKYRHTMKHRIYAPSSTQPPAIGWYEGCRRESKASIPYGK